jgi:hypothetical protein
MSKPQSHDLDQAIKSKAWQKSDRSSEERLVELKRFLTGQDDWAGAIVDTVYFLQPEVEKGNLDLDQVIEVVCDVGEVRGFSRQEVVKQYRETRDAALKLPTALSPDTQPLETKIQLLPVVKMATVQAQKVVWLWVNRIALCAITIVEGIEGVGKSTLLTALAAAVTTGKGLPETAQTIPANVLWLSAEDDLAQVLKPRLLASGVDCERVFAVGEPFTLDQQGLLGLRAAIVEYQPKLVIIDPIFAYTRGDANKGNDARALTSELKTISSQFECAICLVRHVGKSKGLGDPRAAGLYSIEWRAAARSVLLVGADPDQPQKRAITQTKNNLGPLAESLGYIIEPDSTSPSGARFAWTGQSDLTAERILSPLRNEDEDEKVGRKEATDFLREALANGPRHSKEIFGEARQCGISERTINRAKAKLGVTTTKQGREKWVWALPEEGQQTLEHCHSYNLGNVQLNTEETTDYPEKLLEHCQPLKNGHLQLVGNLQGREVFTV